MILNHTLFLALFVWCASNQVNKPKWWVKIVRSRFLTCSTCYSKFKHCSHPPSQRMAKRGIGGVKGTFGERAGPPTTTPVIVVMREGTFCVVTIVLPPSIYNAGMCENDTCIPVAGKDRAWFAGFRMTLRLSCLDNPASWITLPLCKVPHMRCIK